MIMSPVTYHQCDKNDYDHSSFELNLQSLGGPRFQSEQIVNPEKEEELHIEGHFQKEIWMNRVYIAGEWENS